jgi:hypothetical protein
VRRFSGLRPALAFAIAPLAAFAAFCLLQGDIDPARAAFAFAAAASAAALGAALWSRRQAGDVSLAALMVASACVVCLLVSGGGSVLRWQLTGANGTSLPGLGIVVGLLLLAALLGTLLLAADRLSAGASPRGARLGRQALLLAVGLGLIASGLVVFDGIAADTGRWADLAGAAAAIVGFTAALAVGAGWMLTETASAPIPSDLALHHEQADRLAVFAGGLAVLAALVAGAAAWQRAGSYGSDAALVALGAGLAGLAGAQSAGPRELRMGAVLAAAVGAWLTLS